VVSLRVSVRVRVPSRLTNRWPLIFISFLYVLLRYTKYFFLMLVLLAFGVEQLAAGNSCYRSDDVNTVSLFTARHRFWVQRASRS